MPIVYKPENNDPIWGEGDPIWGDGEPEKANVVEKLAGKLDRGDGRSGLRYVLLFAAAVVCVGVSYWFYGPRPDITLARADETPRNKVFAPVDASAKAAAPAVMTPGAHEKYRGTRHAGVAKATPAPAHNDPAALNPVKAGYTK